MTLEVLDEIYETVARFVDQTLKQEVVNSEEDVFQALLSKIKSFFDVIEIKEDTEAETYYIYIKYKGEDCIIAICSRLIYHPETKIEFLVVKKEDIEPK